LYVDIGASGTGGTVYAYGANTSRRAVPQVATSPLTSATAVQDMIAPTGTPSDVVAISAGTAHAVALRADGTLMTWGSNTYGQLGNGTTTLAPYYAEPTLPGGKIAATIHAAGNHTIVRATDGTLVGWGSNLNGVLAGASSGNVLSPTNIATGYTFSQVDTSGYHTTAAVATAVGITTGGTVMAWGSNQFGQLGRTDRPAASSGANKYSDIPVVVQTSGPAALVNADKVVATGYWGAAFRTLTSPQVPSPPLSVTADSPEASKIRAFWSAPATPRELQGYIVEVLRGGSIVFRAGAGRGATSLVMSAPTLDVLNGQEHTLRVYAVNEAGESAVSNSATATPVGVPSVPRNLSVSPRVTGLRVTFETPADLAGLPILDYEVVATPTSGSAASVTVPVGSSPYTVDLTTTDHGLVIGTSYVVTVRACNALRASLSICGPIATSSGVIPGRPTAPLNVAALGLSGSARVSWDAPASDGGAPIASYVVKVYADGGGSALRSDIVNTGIAASMTTTVTGLTNGVSYDITVTASQDSAGSQYFGVESGRVDVIVGRPAAPTNVAAAAHNQPTGGQVRVTWTQVSDQTGITVSHYRWRHKIGSGAFTNGSAIAAGVACSGTSCAATVTGLTNGTTYTFVVEAGTSSTDWGLSSAEVSGTPIGVTTAPGVDATSQDSSASVGITAPVTLNGSEVIRYELKYRPTSGGAWSTTVNLQINEFPYAIADLTNGISYTVSVEAVNDAGNSAAGTATVVPATQPGAPQNVRARPGSIVVTWDAPADTGGATVTSYDIVVTDPDGTSTTFVYNGSSNPAGTTSCTTGRSCTITQVYTSESPDTLVAIPSDIEYTVMVTAVTSAGSGPPSSDSVVVSGQPDAPTNVVATAGFESFELCWTPSSGSITSYKISAVYNVSLLQKEFAAADTATSATCTAPKTGIVVTGWDDGSALVAGGTYSLTLAATYSASDYIYGLASDSVTVTPYGLPGTPTISGITTTTTTATITWTAAAPYGSAITNYTVQASTGDMCAPTATLSCTMTGLIGNASYSFTVYATNAAGDGPPSAAVSATIDATAPTPSWGAPTIGDSRRPTATGTFDENVYYVLTFDEAVTGFDVPDLRNNGTATGCVFQKSQVTPNRVYNVVVQCASTGTLIAQVISGTVTDSATNAGPALNVNAALVTLNDPSSTTTTVAPTTTTIQATTTTGVSANSTSSTVAGATTTTTTVAGDSAPPGTGGGATTTTAAGAGGGGASGGSKSSTTSTIGSGSGLSPAIDRRLDEDENLVADGPVAIGKRVSVRRCGFDPGEVVRLYVAGNLVRTTTADKDGCVEEEVVAPEAAGKKIVVALYAPTSKRGAKTTIEVVGRLVATGTGVDDFVAFGFLSLIVGALLAAVPRRRRR
jgi:YD repeat-containing protein